MYRTVNTSIKAVERLERVKKHISNPLSYRYDPNYIKMVCLTAVRSTYFPMIEFINHNYSSVIMDEIRDEFIDEFIPEFEEDKEKTDYYFGRFNYFNDDD